MTNIIAERYHDICAGHRVYGHENKCSKLHGHNYRFHFKVAAKPGEDSLDRVGRVIDFSIIKETLCDWLETNWDHKMIIWGDDPISSGLFVVLPLDDLVIVNFNPTAENIAKHMVQRVAPLLFVDLCVELIECKVEETRKCGATYILTNEDRENFPKSKEIKQSGEVYDMPF